MRMLISFLLLTTLSTPTFAVAAPDRDETLIHALRQLNERVQRPLAEDLAVQSVDEFSNWWLKMAGASATTLYMFSFVKIPIFHQMAWQQTMSFARWAALASLAGLAAKTGIRAGALAYRRVRRNRQSMNANDYKTREGLVAFFQLPIAKQYLIAITDVDFADYLIQLDHALEILNQGFATDPVTTAP